MAINPSASALLISAVLLASACGPTAPYTPSPETMERSIIEACQGSVKKQLKDPESARFSDWKAWTVTKGTPMGGLTYAPELGDKFYSSGGMVNAKNSFGGYAGNKAYICDGVFSHDGSTYAHARPMPIPGES
ncbi:hypothetical protein [Mycobacteroides abscessus]|uniref:hypothetical protein n=1 Tax=Mycobacteroides abscessus TaxID=36809 RepID=UPI0009A5CECE|nr:hypothetical protein [Mycobacteroides abscessus]SKQ12443.1 Uncharacterised protein [Mycobacteroides abscessus subsp. massiliense]